MSGVSVRTVQRVERGQQASIETLKALAAVFDLDFNTLRETNMTVPNANHQSQQETLALLRVSRIRGFYTHVAQYCVTIIVLTIINLTLSPRHVWVGWVAFGWGLGLATHGLRVFEKLPFLGAAWEKRQVERYLGRGL